MTRRIIPFLAAIALLLPELAAYGDVQASPQHAHRLACGRPGVLQVACAAAIATNDVGAPLASTTPPVGSYGPLQFHTGYNLPCTAGGSVQSACKPPVSFGGQTIAIVDAYAAPNIESDLGIYDQQYGLPACRQKNGCLTIRNMCSFKGGNRSQCFTDQG